MRGRELLAGELGLELLEDFLFLRRRQGSDLAHLLFQLTGLFGLFDTWVDYRKRFARKSPGTGALK